MPRNVVICFDGTSNQFGPTSTNVGRLVRVLAFENDAQIIHYVPGVGTLPEPGFATRIGQKFSVLSGLAFGSGLTRIVEEAYSYLMDFWEPDDRVFLFGFSRGAYTARVLAAMLHAMGLLPRGNQNVVPYAMRLFQSVRSRSASDTARDSNYWKLLNEFRATFSRPIPQPEKADNRRFPVHFLGVWDTVSSVGWAWEPATFPFTSANPSVATVRHALAIDERRWFFRQNAIHPPAHQDCEERWFAGSHGDVGGGYRNDQGQLWSNSFEWMLNAAGARGLLTNPARLAELRAAIPAAPWLEPQHESLTTKWWPAEFFPKRKWQAATKSKSLRLGLGQYRTIPPGAMIHQSALRRIRETAYAPPNLPSRFLDHVRTLSETPEALAVEV